MTRPFLTTLAVLALCSGHAFAQASRVLQKARDMRDQNNARQGLPPAPPLQTPASGAPAPATAASPGASVLPQDDTAYRKLVADIAVLKIKKEVTIDLKKQLIEDLNACVKGDIRPPPESVTKLGGDLATTVNDKKLSGADQTQLAKSVYIILNSARVSSTDAQAALRNANDVLSVINPDAETVKLVVTDLRGIAVDLQGRAPKAAK